MSARARAAGSTALALVIASVMIGPRGGRARADTTPTEGAVVALEDLPDAPFAPIEGAPAAVVHAPTRASEIDVVLHLHGYEGCVSVLIARGPARCRTGAREQEGWDLAAAHAEAGTQSWLVIPQLAFDARDGSPGRLARPGAARRLVDQAVAATALQLGIAPPRVRTVTLTAHSAGFEATLAVLGRGGLDDVIQHVVLFDALYSGVAVFGAWAAARPERSLVAFHTGSGTPSIRARELARRFRRALGPRLIEGERATEADLAPGRVVLLRARTGHRGVPRRHLGPTLAGLLRAG